MQELQKFATTKDGIAKINALPVLRHDILWWLVAVGVMTLLHNVIIWLVIGDSTDPKDRMLAGGAVSGIYLAAQGIMGTWIAVRSKGPWLWIPFITTMLLIGAGFNASLIYTATENSLLHFMLIVVMVLAIGRVIEFIRLKLGEESTRRFKLSVGVWILYISLIVVSFTLTNTYFGAWVL